MRLRALLFAPGADGVILDLRRGPGSGYSSRIATKPRTIATPATVVTRVSRRSMKSRIETP